MKCLWVDDVRHTLQLMLAALKKPVLENAAQKWN